MSSLNAKDRVSLCLFTYQDGRRCRTPRIASHPHFCFYHAQKESQVRSAATLGKDLAYFFSGNYLSACDLSTALSRLIPAVIRGEIKPRLARTVAYMMQTFLQSIHLAQDEYINAFSPDGWRQSIRNSVDANQDYLFPPAPAESDAPEADPLEPDSGESAPAQPAPPQPPQTQPAQTQAPPPTPPLQPAPPPTQPEAAAPPTRPQAPGSPSQPRTAPLPSAAQEACHPERSEGSRLSPAAEAIQPNNPTPPAPPRPRAQPGAPNRDPHAVHYGPEYRLIVDGKPW